MLLSKFISKRYCLILIMEVFSVYLNLNRMYNFLDGFLEDIYQKCITNMWIYLLETYIIRVKYMMMLWNCEVAQLILNIFYFFCNTYSHMAQRCIYVSHRILCQEEQRIQMIISTTKKSNSKPEGPGKIWQLLLHVPTFFSFFSIFFLRHVSPHVLIFVQMIY